MFSLLSLMTTTFQLRAHIDSSLSLGFRVPSPEEAWAWIQCRPTLPEGLVDWLTELDEMTDVMLQEIYPRKHLRNLI